MSEASGMGAKLLAMIERVRQAPWVVLALLFASVVGALAQFTGATKSLIDLVHPSKPDARAELAKLGIPFTPEAMAKAATDNDVRAVGLLLDAGMAVDAHPDAGLPPLNIAAQAGNIAVAQRLIAAGADPAKPSAAGTPIAFAAHYHHPDMVKLFLASRIPAPVVADAFVVAAEVADAASIDLLAPRLDDRRTAATAALHARVERTNDAAGDLPALKALLTLKPDLDAVDDHGQTVLHLAIEQDTTATLAALLAAGAKPDTPGHCHGLAGEPIVPPLACAAVRGTSEGLASVRALVAAHAKVDARTPDGATPLMLAAGNGDANIVTALIAAGADVTLRDAKGRTALDYARAADFNDPAATRAVLSRALAQHHS